MIISRTPYRISLFGGGTDFPAWYTRHGGSVIAASINKYCYLSCRYLPPFFEHSHRIVWSKIEACKSVDEIQHPVVRVVLNHLGIAQGLEIHHIGDLPARSGIGSSSSFTVGLLNALHALEGKMISKHDLTLAAINVEQNLLKENVGAQDQVIASYGGLNHITFHPDGEIDVRPVLISKDRISQLENNLMLFFTGSTRNSSQIQQAFMGKMEEKKRELRILSDLTEEALAILQSNADIMQLGQLLAKSWDAKKDFNELATNKEIEDMHSQAIAAGALSGKISGAGGGGFLLLFVPQEKRQQVRKALRNFIHVPFNFDFGGSQIILGSPLEENHALGSVALSESSLEYQF